MRDYAALAARARFKLLTSEAHCAELMSGGSLADAFKKQRAFGTRRSLEIAADMARGMAYLHNKKPSPIVHRDLKPGNLMAAGSHYYKQCAP